MQNSTHKRTDKNGCVKPICTFLPNLRIICVSTAETLRFWLWLCQVLSYGYDYAAAVRPPKTAKKLHFCSQFAVSEGLTKPNFLAMPNYAYDLT
jgi:hypothetical protein